MRALLAVLVLAAGPSAPVSEWAYADGDLRVKSPGEAWNVQTVVPDAPNIRVAFTKPRGLNSGSILNITVDGTPDLPTPAAYAKRTLDVLQAPPYAFKVRKSGDFTWKGNPASRAEYTDGPGKRFFAQATIKTPRGQMLVATLQAPDAQSYGEDLKVFFTFLDQIDVPPALPATPKGPK